ncbi:hypothetical protein HID58_049860 [Brassica napus]|uniref:Uncharacterized protein n=2 Tax=Brassica napus TaxID=3708 RepID=A0ABQ8B727_BRANA|nr:hypothetical protein HID58_095939 [Brassica napus]KAH0900292.1 hypothetical protein HID58_049860 [Brassica napus]CDY33989.1 BnaC02g43480D [Brassica napus]
MPPTKPYPTGSGFSQSDVKQSTPEQSSAVNSETPLTQADLVLPSASAGPSKPIEPPMPASVAIAASFPELSGNLASATVAESPSASVLE